MKIHRLLVLPILVVLPLLVQCQTPNKKDWETWQSPTGTISISHPKSWIVWKMNAGEVVGFVTPKDNPNDRFPDMLVLMASDNINNETLDDVEARWTQEMKGKPTFNIVSAEHVKLGDHTVFKTIADQIEGDELRLVNYTYTIGEKIYMLSMSIEKRNYDRFKAVGEEAAKSLMVK